MKLWRDGWLSCKYVSNGKVEIAKYILWGCEKRAREKKRTFRFGRAGFYEQCRVWWKIFLLVSHIYTLLLMFADFAAIFVFDEVVMGRNGWIFVDASPLFPPVTKWNVVFTYCFAFSLINSRAESTACDDDATHTQCVCDPKVEKFARMDEDERRAGEWCEDELTSITQNQTLPWLYLRVVCNSLSKHFSFAVRERREGSTASTN